MAEKQLYLHTSNRVEYLAQRLVEVSQATPLSRVLSQETVMTLNPGIARWLQFEIAKLTEVAFGWDFPLPGKLFARVLRGFEPGFDANGAFPEDLARWHLLEILSKLEDQPRFAPLLAYCRSADGSRRFAFASRLTRLFDEYLVYRPETIVAWEDDPSSSRFDWQAEIWRRLLRSLFPKDRKPRHIARLWNDLARGQLLELGQQPRHWPERLFVFGVSSLAPLYLDLLTQLSLYRPVHVFLLQPSDLYWADLKTSKQIQKIVKKAARKQENNLSQPEDWLYETGNPLLPSLGKQSQMFLDLLIDRDPFQDDSSFQAPDEAHSQLSCLQSDLFTIEERDLAKGSEPFPPYDGSLQIHSCSGRRREVETLWDLLVARFEADPQLKPSDVLVMAPDIQDYRSHIEAVFKAKRGTSLELPFSIADSSTARRPGVLSGLNVILRSAASRASAPEVLALLETPLLREVFSFSDQDLERIEFWIRELGITWGWNAAHRKQHEAFPTDLNTWKELRTRLLAGMTFSQDTVTPDGFLAYSEIEGEHGETAGRLLECLELFQNLRDAYRQTHSLDTWQERLLSLLSSLRCKRDDWQRDYMKASELIQETIPALSTVLCTGAEAYQAVAEKLESNASGGGYLSGGITFCSLKPMRAIPANTVGLMGMNRLDFPRRSNRLSFDLMANETRIGDRNTRDEDRQFFLETLLSVRSHLFITYQGSAPNSDALSEPSAVVEELLNYLHQAMEPVAFASILQKQKRQSFDPSYFEQDSNATYDPDRAELRNRFNQIAPTERDEELAPVSLADSASIDSLDLESLIAYIIDPAKQFTKNIAKLRLANEEDALQESDTLLSGGLDRYQIRQAFAEKIMRGETLDTLESFVFSQKKWLPLGFLETPTFAGELENAQRLAENLGDLQTQSNHCQIEVQGIHLSGESLTRTSDGRQILVHAGELKPKRLIDAWIRHLFASCANPPFTGDTYILSLHDKKQSYQLGHVENPRELLAFLVDCFVTGQATPLRFFAELSYSASKAWLKGPAETDEERSQLAIEEARKKLRSGQSDNPYNQGIQWTAYDRICHGDDFVPDTEFVQLANAIWLPFENAKSNLSLDTLLEASK